ncbi:MAG: hypothetical protein GF329_05360 [Candidatus Lokiarchaeota archaeon]|nr:hypothetical protein [Candidatus Lokiarchaeota archaeon]
MTLYVINKLRNAHIHSDSPISGSEKEELNLKINTEKKKLIRYNLYYSETFFKQNLDKDFENYLKKKGIKDIKKLKDYDLLYYRARWSYPSIILNKILDLHHNPKLISSDLPQTNTLELHFQEPGNLETLYYLKNQQKIRLKLSRTSESSRAISQYHIGSLTRRETLPRLPNTISTTIPIFFLIRNFKKIRYGITTKSI